ncbi:MAG TPA: heme-dependent oxidative N-demethylase subunit alpha family protein, partial [Myxococcota bacterium]
GWRPELLRRASFAAIHEPVPGFVKDVRAARSMVKSMVERGPYVRFVWTISADDHLDHHPLHGRRRSLLEASASSCWLRIERQTTVPFTDVGGSLFLIRTLLRPLSALTTTERDVVAEALRVMPDEIAAYKGLAAGRAHVIALIDAMR